MVKDFTVVYEAPDFYSRGPLIHCYDGDRLVLTVIAREAIEDYFRLPTSTPEQRSLLVDGNNLAGFGRITAAKYEAGEVGSYSGYGATHPLVTVTLDDITKSGETFTDDVLKMAAGAGFQRAR